MRWGTNEVSPTVPISLPGASFQAVAYGGRAQAELRILSETSKQTWGLRKPRQPGLTGQSSREDRAEYRETCEDLRRAPHEYAYEYWSAHACEESC